MFFERPRPGHERQAVTVLARLPDVTLERGFFLNKRGGTMRTFRKSAVLLAVFANILAAQVVTTLTSRQTGNLVGASASSSGALFSANVNISPTASPKGGDAYLVT